MTPLYTPHITLRHKWAATRQLWSGWIGPGKTCDQFRDLLCETVGRQYGTLTNSGTSALMLAYLALDLKPGQTVCCPAYGFPAAHNAARLLGLNVRLIDVDPATGAMCPNALWQALHQNHRLELPPGSAMPLSVYDSPQSRCVVFVDHNGCTTGLAEVAKTCKQLSIPLIEDSAVALGIPGAGITGDLAIYSFSVPKIITTGQGGAVLTDNPDLAKRLNQLVDQGGDWRQDRIHKAIGGNFRLNDMQAALGLAQLRDLPRLIAKRNRLWGWYREHITIHNDPGAGKSGWMVTTENRGVADIILNDNGNEARRLYQPVHRCEPYLQDDATFPGAMEYYRRMLYLPSSLGLTRQQVNRVGQIVRDFQC